MRRSLPQVAPVFTVHIDEIVLQGCRPEDRAALAGATIADVVSAELTRLLEGDGELLAWVERITSGFSATAGSGSAATPEWQVSIYLSDFDADSITPAGNDGPSTAGGAPSVARAGAQVAAAIHRAIRASSTARETPFAAPMPQTQAPVSQAQAWSSAATTSAAAASSAGAIGGATDRRTRK
jgi:hypothetical protein